MERFTRQVELFGDDLANALERSVLVVGIGRKELVDDGFGGVEGRKGRVR